MKETILHIYSDENGNILAEKQDDRTMMVLNIAGYITNEFFVEKNVFAMDALLGVVCHVLARDSSGNMEKDFIRGIKNNCPEMRKLYERYIKDIGNNTLS